MGERYFDPTARHKARELLSDVEHGYDVAAMAAAGDSPDEIIAKLAGTSNVSSARYLKAYDRYIKITGSRHFVKAATTLSDAKVSPGRDLADWAWDRRAHGRVQPD